MRMCYIQVALPEESEYFIQDYFLLFQCICDNRRIYICIPLQRQHNMQHIFPFPTKVVPLLAYDTSRFSTAPIRASPVSTKVVHSYICMQKCTHILSCTPIYTHIHPYNIHSCGPIYTIIDKRIHSCTQVQLVLEHTNTIMHTHILTFMHTQIL